MDRQRVTNWISFSTIDILFVIGLWGNTIIAHQKPSYEYSFTWGNKQFIFNTNGLLYAFSSISTAAMMIFHLNSIKPIHNQLTN